MRDNRACWTTVIRYKKFFAKPVVKVMMILTFLGKSLGIHDVAPF